LVLESAEEGNYNHEAAVTENPNMQATSLVEKMFKQVDDNCSKDGDASVRLLKESISTNDVIDADSTSVVIHKAKNLNCLWFPL
jgi:hypothetical protein